MVKKQKKSMISRLSAVVLCLVTALSPLFGSTPWNVAHAEAAPIELRRIDGSGKAFIYHSFSETKTFTVGETYAFLNGIYGAEDAVSSLGAGAILQATTYVKTNNCDFYIACKYGVDAKAKVYVNVATPGKDFDHCKSGGLYEVPNSGTPTEYRYFCKAGGAQNCGPYYAYTYEEESVAFGGVSAKLNSIEKQGSKNPADYTVTITYDGNKTKVLDPGSYTVTFTDPDRVTFVISDSVGNAITANFQSPLAIRYDGNAANAFNTPAVQAAWAGERSTVSSQKPTRSGYAFVNWKNAAADKTYTAGQSFAPASSMQLFAQWRDTQAPTIGYTATQVMTGDTDAAVESAVRAALTITDNEPVSECTVTVTVPKDFTKTPGNKDVTVTATDKAGNTATVKCTVYVSSYVDISRPVFTKGTKKLTATLHNPGTDPITKSGFVWGIMNAPTLTVNNGSAATSTVASKAGDTLSVTASNLQNGLTYYARAYITAGDITYYSEEIQITLDLLEYGTFTIKNNDDNTFTVTRTGGTAGTQTVYYRTVNGSAAGGTYFKHAGGTLTFYAGQTSKTVTVTEKGANAWGYGKPSIAYSNADRVYSMEIYRVDGGASLGEQTIATRTMKTGADFKVNRNYYTDYKRFASYTDEVERGDYEKDGLGWYKNVRGSADSRLVTISIPGLSENYWRNTAGGLSYYMQVKIKEVAAGYQHIQITPGDKINTAFYPESGKYLYNGSGNFNFSTMDPAAYAMTLEHGGASGITKTYGTYCFPYAAGTSARKPTTELKKSSWGNALLFAVDTKYISIGYSASGGGSDKWAEKDEFHYIKLLDFREPQFVKAAPMADSVYKPGDPFTVSLIFDEIVDSVNSVNIDKVTVNTTWGTASYVGGVDTNVLYFQGTVAQNASKTLTINSVSGTEYIKDMCDDDTYVATKDIRDTPDTKATVDTSVPHFTVTANGITNGVGKATVTVNADQKKTTGMRYAWSDSSLPPANGWIPLSTAELNTAKNGGLPLSIRKEPGSGVSNGKWYLHVTAVYDTTGATVYNNAVLDFGTAAKPADGSTSPALTVSAINTSWATGRKITIAATGAEKLQYRKSGDTAWKTLSKTATSVTVYENGHYTFLLTAGEEVITKTVEVSRLDLKKPTASVGEPTSASLLSPQPDVYTKLVLPITYADADSGVRDVYYRWTNSATTPTSFSTKLQTGAKTVTYTASETAQTAKYLHIKVTDNVGRVYTTCSSPYTVISQKTVETHTPTITITGEPTAWTNDTATLTWQLADHDGKRFEVILPDGRISTETSGEVWARQNGDYTVTVRDLTYGGENSATAKVDKLDFDPPTVDVSGSASGWSKNDQTVTITASDSQSGVGEKWYAIVSDVGSIPTAGLTKLVGNTVTVSDEGQYYIYYKIYDNAGDTQVSREANKAEGFALVQIDKTAPTVDFGTYAADTGLPVTVRDGKNGVVTSGPAAVTYQIESGTETVKTGSTPTSGESDVGFALTGLPAGDVKVTVTAVDKAGNRFVTSKELHIDIVSVDITWAAMEFTYADGNWNAAKHTYDGRGWKPDTADGNKITVRNSGDIPLGISYSYTSTNAAVSGGFTDGDAPITAPIALPVAEEKSAWLVLNGKPAGSLKKDVLGAVTVTIEEDQNGG